MATNLPKNFVNVADVRCNVVYMHEGVRYNRKTLKTLLVFCIPAALYCAVSGDREPHKQIVEQLLHNLLRERLWPVFNSSPLVLDNVWNSKTKVFTPFQFFNSKVRVNPDKDRNLNFAGGKVPVIVFLETFGADPTFKIVNHSRRYQTLKKQRNEAIVKALEGFEEAALALVDSYFANFKDTDHA